MSSSPQYDADGHPIKPNKNNNTNNNNNYNNQQQYNQQQQQQREYEAAGNSYTNNNNVGMSRVANAHAAPQYDANGHPIKPSQQQQQQQQLPQQQQYQQQYQQPGYGQQGPVYDANGNPIKPQPPLPHQQQQQQQQYGMHNPQQAHYGNGMPAYAAGVSAGVGQQVAYPSNTNAYGTGGNYSPANQQPPQQQSYYPQQQQQQQQGSAMPYQQQQQPQQQYQPGPASGNFAAQSLQQRNFWTTGLCDTLADCDVCMEVMCCWSCQEARMYDAIHHDRSDSLNGLVCCVSFLSQMFQCWPIINFYARRSIIEKYNLQDEGCITSACFSMCCPCNSACQIQRELNARGVYPGGQCCATKIPAQRVNGPSGYNGMR